MKALDTRRSENSVNTSSRELFFLQEIAGTAKMYTSKLLQQFAVSKRHHFMNIENTWIAPSPFESGRTLHSLLVLNVDDKDSSGVTAPNSSNCGLRSDRSKMFQKAAFIIVESAFYGGLEHFKMIDFMLKYLQCHWPNSPKPWSRVLCTLSSGSYWQLLPVISSCKLVEDDHGNGRYINTPLLDQLPGAPNLCDHTEGRRLTWPVRQSLGSSFRSFLIVMKRAHTVHPLV